MRMRSIWVRFAWCVSTIAAVSVVAWPGTRVVDRISPALATKSSASLHANAVTAVVVLVVAVPVVHIGYVCKLDATFNQNIPR